MTEKELKRLRSTPDVRRYLATALWTATDEMGNQLDTEFDIDDFTDESFVRSAAELAQFQREVDRVVATMERAGTYNEDDYDYDSDDLVHDFWLTRNGHGVGFWDRPEKYGPLADVLSELSRRAGEVNVFSDEESHTLEIG